MAEPNTAMGYLHRVTANGNSLSVRNSSIDRNIDVHEVGQTEDGQYKASKGGRKEMRGSCQVYEDATVNYFATPLFLNEGQYVELEVEPQDGADSYSVEALISNVRHGMDVNNPNDISFNWVSNGEYSVPTT